MNGTPQNSAGEDVRRRKLLFRSWHRGMREVDLILGRFANAELAGLTAAEIDQYERLLDVSDTELLPWLTGQLPVPSGPYSGILLRILAFCRKTSL